jgi:hypothetical protein
MTKADATLPAKMARTLSMAGGITSWPQSA